jgi:hypothetical protein
MIMNRSAKLYNTRSNINNPYHDAADGVGDGRVGVETVNGVVGDGRGHELEREAHGQVAHKDRDVLQPPHVQKLLVRRLARVLVVVHRL